MPTEETLRVIEPSIKIRRVLWLPLEDITAYEVARAVPMLLNLANGNGVDQEYFDALPDGVKRHFEIKKKA